MTAHVDIALSAMSSHVEAMEERLGRGAAELDRLCYEVEAARIWVDEKPALDMRLIELRNRFEHARARLKLLRASGKKRWEAFRADVEFAVNEFEKALSDDR